MHELAGATGPQGSERRRWLVGRFAPPFARAERGVAVGDLVQQALGHRARRQADVRAVGVLDRDPQVAGQLRRRRRRPVRPAAHQPLGLGPHSRVDTGQNLALCCQAGVDEAAEPELLPARPPPVQRSRRRLLACDGELGRLRGEPLDHGRCRWVVAGPGLAGEGSGCLPRLVARSRFEEMGQASLRPGPVGVGEQLGRRVADDRCERKLHVEEPVARGDQKAFDGHHDGAALGSPPPEPDERPLDRLDVVLVAFVGDGRTRTELSSHGRVPGARSTAMRR